MPPVLSLSRDAAPPGGGRVAAASPNAAGVSARATAAMERECPHCGLFQIVPPLPAHANAQCPRCHATLRRGRVAPLGRPLALAAAAMALLLIAVQLPFLDLSSHGLERRMTLLTGPEQLEQHGMWLLGVVVFCTTLLVPLARLLALAWVLLCLHLRHRPRHLALVFRWVEVLRPWSMVEVFLLGGFVAYTKLGDLAEVQLGLACYLMGAVMLAMAGVDATLDSEAVWEALAPDPRAPPVTPAGAAARSPRAGTKMGCDICGQVSLVADGPARSSCPRCGAGMRVRKPHSFSRTLSLTAAAACLYLPANVLPVLTLVRLGRGQPSTILGGVEQLVASHMYPLALLVFFASITVPVLKVVSLALMLVTTRRRSRWRLVERTRLYRIVDFIGRWSMIDVFMISILTALVRMGILASVYPGPGVLAFCAVVILTMIAAASFDPRLMWDAAGENPA